MGSQTFSPPAGAPCPRSQSSRSGWQEASRVAAAMCPEEHHPPRTGPHPQPTPTLRSLGESDKAVHTALSKLEPLLPSHTQPPALPTLPPSEGAQPLLAAQ